MLKAHDWESLLKRERESPAECGPHVGESFLCGQLVRENVCAGSESSIIDVRVPLSRDRSGVPEQLADKIERLPGADEMAREAVTEIVEPDDGLPDRTHAALAGNLSRLREPCGFADLHPRPAQSSSVTAAVREKIRAG